MPTEAEIIAAQEYFYNLKISVAGKRLGAERDQWVAAQTAYKSYREGLTPAEQKIYTDENARYNAVVADQIKRERETAKREHWQDFTVKAGTFAAAALAAPAVLGFGPATGGLYAPGSILGPAVVAEGMAISPAGLPYITDAGLAPSLQPAAPSLLDSLYNLGKPVVEIASPVIGAVGSLAKPVVEIASPVIDVVGSLVKPVVETTSSVLDAVGALKETAAKVQNIFSDSSVPETTGQAEYQKLLTQGQLTGAPGVPGVTGAAGADSDMLYIIGGIVLLFLFMRSQGK